MRGTVLRLGVGAIAATLLAAGAPLGGGSVIAAVSDCAAGEVCVWTGANYTGTVATVMDEACHDAAVGSALNGDPDTTQELRVFAQPGCSGPATIVRGGARSGTLSGRSYLDWHSATSPP